MWTSQPQIIIYFPEVHALMINSVINNASGLLRERNNEVLPLGVIELRVRADLNFLLLLPHVFHFPVCLLHECLYLTEFCFVNPFVCDSVCVPLYVCPNKGLCSFLCWITECMTWGRNEEYFKKKKRSLEVFTEDKATESNWSHLTRKQTNQCYKSICVCRIQHLWQAFIL